MIAPTSGIINYEEMKAQGDWDTFQGYMSCM